MTDRVIFGALLGAAIGFGMGYLGSRAGTSCPFMCNPYIAGGIGLLLGALLAGSGHSSVRDYTPSPHLMEVDSADQFRAEVLEANQPVLVAFSRANCPHCERLKPTMHELADEFEGRALMALARTTSLKEVASKYDVSAVPTLVLFKAGEAEETLVGYREKDELAQLISSVSSEPAAEE
ncbi:MAG: thioredoxin family protein [Planctomycetota bacterium]